MEDVAAWYDWALKHAHKGEDEEGVTQSNLEDRLVSRLCTPNWQTRQAV
jgi:hypothetical protein